MIVYFDYTSIIYRNRLRNQERMQIIFNYNYQVIHGRE